MASCANNLKMIHEIVRGRKRVFFWGLVLALAVTLAGACWIILYLSYRHGGINLEQLVLAQLLGYPPRPRRG